MTIRLAAAIAVVALLTACSGDQPTTEPSPPAAEPTAEQTAEPTPEPTEDTEDEEPGLIAQLEEASEELGWDSAKCVEAVPFQLSVYDPGLVDDEDTFGEAYQAAVEFCETLDEPPVGDAEVDFAARDIEGEPATAGLIDTIEGMSLPDGAVQVINASMVRHKKVYYVVAAVADTPDGVQILTYLHAPWDQSDIDGSGITEPLNFAAQQWAPLAGASDDDEAYEIGERLIVERP